MAPKFFNFRTNNVFPDPDGPNTIHVNGCFHFKTSSTGSDLLLLNNIDVRGSIVVDVVV